MSPLDIQQTEAPAPGGSPATLDKQHGKQYENHVLVKLIEKIASEDPQRPFLSIPSSDNAQEGWKPVTFQQFNTAIDYLAHSLSKISKTEEFPTIAYIGPSDLRYCIILFACIKAGFKALFISPRNTPAVQLSLFEDTKCDVLYCTETYEAAMKPCLEQRKMQVCVIDSVEHFLNVSSSPFPYDKSIDQARWDPLVVLHTSGSTGIPKPIVVKQGTFFALEDMLRNGSFNGCPFAMEDWGEKGTKILLSMPMFHAAGVYATISGIFTETTTVMSLPNKPLGVDSVLECLEGSGAQGVVLPPFIVEGLAASEKGVKALLKLQFLKFAGGNLSPAVGDFLVEKGVKLNNLIASTESFPYALYHPIDPKLWKYFVFDSETMNIDWRQCGPNEYEFVIVRKDMSDPGSQSVFYIFPELSEWSTKDIFQPHPTLKDYWLYKGRADDIIVFSNGEKLNPVSIEAAVSGHPIVNGALVVGQGRFQAALIVEPVDEAIPMNDDERKAFIDKVWPVVEKANAETVGHGRIAKDLIAVADPALPFARAGKTTVQRAATVKLYEQFIEGLYEKAQDGGTDTAASLNFDNEEALAQSIVAVFQTSLGVTGLEVDTDFFAAGIDSLQIINVTKIMKTTLQAANIDTTEFEPRTVYQHPTAKELASYILSGSQDESKEIKETERLISKYTENLPVCKADKQPPADENQIVLVTGTTGSLGAYFLHDLCQLPSVSKIIALNRAEDGGASRQPSINETRGLTQNLSKVEFLHADLSLPDFGLGQDRYNSLLASADRIIHNAWPVNFNISVSSFESSIRGVRHLIDFSAAAAKDVPIIFISSIGTADGWKSSKPVPEEPLTDITLPQMGYGRSKLAASLILDTAVKNSGIHGASVRVGQIAGPRAQKGIWNKQEFIPSLIASSVYLGILPDHLGPQQEVTWTPIEDVSGLLLDIAGITTPKPASEISGYFHGVNPSVADWSTLAPAVKNFYGDAMKTVALDEWVERLEASAKETDVDVERNTGVKLLDTYRGLLEGKKQGRFLRFEIDRTKKASPTIRNAGAITEELMVNWCRQWGY
ncbi:linear gramicidin synthase subunit d [Fusarium flagelliforme]|uniref:Linear gramicidin synthase subunit d n=1 Tax=Fusarium flagelliforme TaxID=2675880 RepID=A0A395N3C0_9HYPO|nr:linear gramicidin synthase subunit d [Fusarium flagelliforme]